MAGVIEPATYTVSFIGSVGGSVMKPVLAPSTSRFCLSCLPNCTLGAIQHTIRRSGSAPAFVGGSSGATLTVHVNLLVNLCNLHNQQESRAGNRTLLLSVTATAVLVPLLWLLFASVWAWFIELGVYWQIPVMLVVSLAIFFGAGAYAYPLLGGGAMLKRFGFEVIPGQFPYVHTRYNLIYHDKGVALFMARKVLPYLQSWQNDADGFTSRMFSQVLQADISAIIQNIAIWSADEQAQEIATQLARIDTPG
jgi:hypothetical protein